jgi:stage V sporulation protein B
MKEKDKTPPGERKLAKGILYGLFSKVVYILSTYLIYISIGRILGPEDFGIFGTVFAILNVLYVFFLSGLTPSVARHIAGDESIARPVTWAALKIQLIVAISLSSLIFFGAEFIALKVLGDNNFTFYIRLASLTIIPIALINVYVGALLGVRSFIKVALTLIVRSIVRAALTIGLVLAGFGISGAIFGYICSAFIGVLFIRLLCNFPKSNTQYNTKKLVVFAIPLLISGGLVSLLLNMDTVLLKRIIGDNDQVGYYIAASTIAQSLYFLITAFNTSLLPSMSLSYKNNDLALTRKYIHQSIRYLFLIYVPIVAIVSATSQELTVFLYGDNFQSAGLPLSILIFGVAFFSLSLVLSTIIVAIGRPWISTSFFTLAVFLSLISNLFLIKAYGLVGAAVATSLACFLSFVLNGLYVFQRFKIFIRLLSLCRILAAGSFIYMIAKIIPITSVTLPLCYVLLIILYAIIIFILHELQNEDYKVIRGIIKKQPQTMSLV